MDVDNPTLREWCLLFIRNITSWSEEIRAKLSKLTMVSDTSGQQDLESLKSFEALGGPMKDMYHKEMDKYKRDEEDQRKLQEALRAAENVHVVDF